MWMNSLAWCYFANFLDVFKYWTRIESNSTVSDDNKQHKRWWVGEEKKSMLSYDRKFSQMIFKEIWLRFSRRNCRVNWIYKTKQERVFMNFLENGIILPLYFHVLTSIEKLFRMAQYSAHSGVMVLFPILGV